MCVFPGKDKTTARCIVCHEGTSKPSILSCSHIVCLGCLGHMTTLADREQLYAHHLRCPNIDCREIINIEILLKYGLINDKLKSLYENALYKPPSQGAAAQDYDKDLFDLMVTRKLARCHCGFTIERTGGCNHMACRCGRHFCYSCNATLSARDARYTCTKCIKSVRPAPPVIIPVFRAPVPCPVQDFTCAVCGRARSRRGLLFDDHTLTRYLYDAHGFC